MSQPFDLDAAVGGQVGQPFTFTWGGKRFELPPAMSLPVDRLLRMISLIDGIDNVKPEEISEILGLLIDDETLASLSAARPMSVDALMRLVGAWVSDQGDALGKSSASPRRSASTARPSKQTSRSGRARKTS